MLPDPGNEAEKPAAGDGSRQCSQCGSLMGIASLHNDAQAERILYVCPNCGQSEVVTNESQRTRYR